MGSHTLYINKFAFRYNNRIKLGVNDYMWAAKAIRGACGKRLTYQGTRTA